jgi:signal transduction histidine kinase
LVIDPTEALRITVLFVGWPGMALVSGYVLWSTWQFHQRVNESPFGRLVLLMVIGWTITMGILAFVATLYLQRDPESVGPYAAGFLAYWAATMTIIVWLVNRWGEETVHINLYYTELAAMDRVKSQLINTVAHELNTPLTPILLKFSLLRTGRFGELSAGQREVVDSIERNLAKLQVLVEQVVLSTQIQTGRLTVVPTEFEVDAWVAGVASRFEAQAQADGRRFSVSAETGATLQGDRGRLDRVLTSLVDNAFRFSGKGDPIEVTATRTDSQVLVRVRDAGRGLTPEQRALLFQPFRHPHDPKEVTVSGAGLSLYIAKAIVDSHGGRLWADSPGSGQGATFTISLPMKPPEVAPSVREPPVASP